MVPTADGGMFGGVSPTAMKAENAYYQANKDDLGVPGMVSSTWWGIGVPAKTPGAVQERLRAATLKILADPGYVGRLASMAVEPMSLTPEQTNAFVAGEVKKWKSVAR